MNKINFVGIGEHFRMSNLRFLPVMMSDDHPRVGIFLNNMVDVYVTTVYLFIDQLVKLVKWMNYNQDIGMTKFSMHNMTNNEFLI